MVRTAAIEDTNVVRPSLFVALELSKGCWKLAFTTGRLEKARIRDVPARNLDRFLQEVEQAKKHYGLADDAVVLSCYEAGRDGFWIHRCLEANGITNLVVDPASIEVDRRARRAKTDQIDAQKLAQLLARHGEGESVLRVVQVPPPEAEDAREIPRLLQTLKHKRTQTSNQIRAALFRHGVDLDPRKGKVTEEQFLEDLEAARQWDGSELPQELRASIGLLWEQFALTHKQIADVEGQLRRRIRDAENGEASSTAADRKSARLAELRGIAVIGATMLVTELFGWRQFGNRKQVASIAGLTGTPHQSGSLNREQGISKAGNPRVRRLMVELAWLWLRHQPQSRTTLWFHDHVGKAGSRSKRKAIVAVARKLLVELWHYVEHGVIPEGATLKTDPLRTSTAA